MSERAVDLVPGLVRGHKRDGRCIYDREAKRELVRRSLQPGVSVAGLALAHGINANLLRKWITVATGRQVIEEEQAPILLPVTTTHAEPVVSRPADGHLELVLPGGTIRICGRVEAEALRIAVDCLARRA
jgi:transposase